MKKKLNIYLGFKESVLYLVIMRCFVSCKGGKLLSVGVDVGGMLSMMVRLWVIGEVEQDVLLCCLTSLIVILLAGKVEIDEGMRRDGDVRVTSIVIQVGRDAGVYEKVDSLNVP